MKIWVVVLVGLVCVGLAVPALAQQTGEIYGQVVDTSGAVMPGVTVTISGPVLLQPEVAVTSQTGTYRFPQLPIGAYSVKFELAGFKTLLRDGIRLEMGLNVQVNVTLEVGTISETLTVSGQQALVDLKDTSKGARYTLDALQAIPSARDPWVMIERTPGVIIDRENVGGNMSSNQSNFTARGADTTQSTWSLDGVDLTDHVGLGGTTFYYDFDAVQEMQITTGSSDPSMQTAGVGVNIVTKSGTDKLRGSARTYVTDQKFESYNVTDQERQQGISAGNPIQNIQDDGLEAGGPIMKGRAWFWGAFSYFKSQQGINGYFQPSASCQTMKADLAANPLSHSVADVRSCLTGDTTTIKNEALKVGVVPFKNNQFTWSNVFDGKTNTARGAGVLNPIETTWAQRGVSSAYGPWGWGSGPEGLWKATDQHVFTDRWVGQVQWSHDNHSHIIDFHAPDLTDVQPTYEITTGTWGRSYYNQAYIEPIDGVNLTTNYFLPGKWGGDHAFKAGYNWRSTDALTLIHWGGNAEAMFTNGVSTYARMYRDDTIDPRLNQQSAYIQDTYTHNRFTANLGLRWDRQADSVGPSNVPASPFEGQLTLNGTPFTYLPAVNFPGVNTGIVWNNFAPRLGLTYNATGNSKNVLKASFAQYYGQRADGALASPLNTIGNDYVEYAWTDLNHDGFIQANEINTAKIITYGGQYNPANPAQTVSPNQVDPNIKNQRTDEMVFSFDRQLATDVGLSFSYIWRNYTNFAWNQLLNVSSSDYTAVNYTPPATACPAGARCLPVTYYVPNAPLPSPYLYTNQPDYSRRYQGLEASMNKRMSHNWMMSGSLAYNSTIVNYGSPASYQDPTNITMLNGAQYAPVSNNSIANIYLNARWVAKLTGAYTLPWYNIGLAASYNARQGFPVEPAINIASRPNLASSVAVLLDPIGTVRVPTFQQVDFRLDKPFTFGRTKIIASMDVFNLFNAGTVLSQLGNQNAANANLPSSILAPRVLRFGLRLTF